MSKGWQPSIWHSILEYPGQFINWCTKRHFNCSLFVINILCFFFLTSICNSLLSEFFQTLYNMFLLHRGDNSICYLSNYHRCLPPLLSFAKGYRILELELPHVFCLFVCFDLFYFTLFSKGIYMIPYEWTILDLIVLVIVLNIF